MQASKHLVLSISVLAVIALFTNASPAETASEEQVVYEQDFEKAVGAEWSNGKTDSTPNGERRFLGQFGAESVSLTLDDLPGHSTVTVCFDLFIIRTWDGNYRQYGPDFWDLSVTDGPKLLRTTFSNSKNYQSYPEAGTDGNHPPCSEAEEINTLGYEWRGTQMDSVYRLSFTFEHSGNRLQLNFSAAGLEQLANESWGLDNLQVCISGQSVPEVKPAAAEAKAVYLPFRPKEPLAEVIYEGELEVDTLAEGVRAFSNRQYKFLNVPFDLRGLKFIRHAGGSHEGYPLRVLSEGLLLVGTWDHEEGSEVLSDKGWEPTGMSFYYDDQGGSRLRVWVKKVEKGIEDIPDRAGFIGNIAIAPGFRAAEPVESKSEPAKLEQFKCVEVQATQNEKEPLVTGIVLQEGQCFALEPYPQDRWTGGGTKTGVWCDYMGYADRGYDWMRLKYQVGNNKACPVVHGAKCIAESDGELKLFCNDEKTNDNKGEVRVLIKVWQGSEASAVPCVVKKDEQFQRLLEGLEVVSAGNYSGNMARVSLNKKVLFNGGKRGITLLAFEGDNVHPPVSFDTFADQTAADRFADAVASLPRGCTVVLVVQDEATGQFNDRAQQAILSVGGKVGLLGQPYRCSYYCIGRKDMEQGLAIEQAGLRKLYFPAREVEDSVIKLRFDSKEVLKRFVCPARQAWKVEDGKLIGVGAGPTEKPFLTYKTHFKGISEVVIKGSVLPIGKVSINKRYLPRTPKGSTNFRVSVGRINLIFNHETGNENQYRTDQVLTVQKGHALTPGKEHTIAIKQVRQKVVVTVDNKQVYTNSLALDGTVTVYPAHGSTISISEIDITGIADPERKVKEHSHTNTF